MMIHRRGTIAADPSPNQSYCWDRSSYDNSSIYSDYSGDPVESTEKEEGDSTEPKLAPQDGGRQAWTVLIAGFVIEAILWGRNNHLLFLAC